MDNSILFNDQYLKLTYHFNLLVINYFMYALKFNYPHLLHEVIIDKSIERIGVYPKSQKGFTLIDFAGEYLKI